jgi:hypothetical protein
MFIYRTCSIELHLYVCLIKICLPQFQLLFKQSTVQTVMNYIYVVYIGI